MIINFTYKIVTSVFFKVDFIFIGKSDTLRGGETERPGSDGCPSELGKHGQFTFNSGNAIRVGGNSILVPPQPEDISVISDRSFYNSN